MGMGKDVLLKSNSRNQVAPKKLVKKSIKFEQSDSYKTEMEVLPQNESQKNDGGVRKSSIENLDI